MKQSLKRMTGTILTASLLCPALVLSGCGKTPKRDVPEVTEDMPWYQSTITSVDPGLVQSEYTYLGIDPIGKAGDHIVFESYGQRPFGPYDIFTSDFNDYMINVYDSEGAYCYDKDVKEIIMSSAGPASNIQVNDIVAVGENLIITANFTVETEFKYQAFTYDIDSQEVVSVRDVMTADELANDLNAAYQITNYSCQVEDYFVKNYEIPLDVTIDFHVEFTDANGEVTDIKISDELPNEMFVLASNFLYLGDSEYVFMYEDYVHENKLVYIDLTTGNVADAASVDEYSWLYDVKDIWDFKYYDGIGNAKISQDGIMMLDLESHEESIYINFDDCDINRFDVSDMELLDVEEGKVTLAGTVLRNQESELVFDYEAQIVILQKCDTNPHVGEKILTAASFDKLSYPMAEAIRLFNLNNEDAIIVMDHKYDYDTVAEEIIFDVNMDETTYDLQVKAAFMNLLSVDLLANEGPDIILGTMDQYQLDNSDMMLDLSDCVEVEGVYENVMGFAKTGDKLYQVPVSVELEGIVVDKDDVDTSVSGFTYSSYNAYVSGPCNGSDPCFMKRLTFMTTVIAEMGDSFRKDGGYDYNNEEFAAAAAFVNDLNLLSDEEWEEQNRMYSWMSGTFSDCANITNGLEFLYRTQSLVDENILMGYPSAEPRGLLLNVKQSVGVCAGTGAPDQCKDFVKMLVGEEIQTIFGKYCGISVNSNAQAAACREFTDMMNGYFNTISEVHSYSDRELYEEPLEEADPERVVAVMDGYIRNASGFRQSDAAVELIVREEIQAYFAGQKTIEEVMETIQNRVDLYVNERG